MFGYFQKYFLLQGEVTESASSAEGYDLVLAEMHPSETIGLTKVKNVRFKEITI